jgi:glycosyltransferase 2 family protein
VTAALPQRRGDLAVNARFFSRRSSTLITVLKVSLSILAIATVLMTVDLSAAWHRMVNQNIWLLVLAAAIMSIQIGLGGLRWRVILKELGAPTKLWHSLRLFYIAAFFNSYLWSSIGGDVMRAWLSHRAHVNASTAVTSVLLDRVAAVAGVALLVLATAPLFMTRAGYIVSGFVPAGIALAGLAGIYVVAQVHRLPLDWQRTRLMRGCQSLSSATRTIFFHPAAALPALGLAVLAQSAMAISAYVVGLSLDIGLTLLDSLILMQPVALIASLPISIGGWGVREIAMIALLGLVDIPANAVLSLSVQLGLLVMVVSLPGLPLWLSLKDRVQAAYDPQHSSKGHIIDEQSRITQ